MATYHTLRELRSEGSIYRPSWWVETTLGRWFYRHTLLSKGWETNGGLDSSERWRHSRLFGASQWMTAQETLEIQIRVKSLLSRILGSPPRIQFDR